MTFFQNSTIFHFIFIKNGSTTSLKNHLKSCKKAVLSVLCSTSFVTEYRTGKEEKGIRHAAQFVYVSNNPLNKFVKNPIFENAWRLLGSIVTRDNVSTLWNPENNALVEQVRLTLSNRPTSDLLVLSFDKWTAVLNAKYFICMQWKAKARSAFD